MRFNQNYKPWTVSGSNGAHNKRHSTNNLSLVFGQFVETCKTFITAWIVLSLSLVKESTNINVECKQRNNFNMLVLALLFGFLIKRKVESPFYLFIYLFLEEHIICPGVKLIFVMPWVLKN